MRRANVIAGFVLAVFGIAMITIVIPWQIETGPPGMMSPRLVPNLMMATVTGLAFLLLLTNLPRGKQAAEKPDRAPISRAELIAMGKIAMVFAVSIALYLWLSPLAAGIALVVGALLVLGERRPLVIVAMPVFLLLGIWFIFYRVLGTAIL